MRPQGRFFIHNPAQHFTHLLSIKMQPYIPETHFHIFSENELSDIELPSLFTFPFCYKPHPLCKIAASKVMDYLSNHNEWNDELRNGKMMGVLIVQKGECVGYLAAYSGNLGHCSAHDYFVPAVCDLLSESSFFVPEEKAISAINRAIDTEINSPNRKSIIENLEHLKSQAQEDIERYKTIMRSSKIERDRLRKQGHDNHELIAESQYQKAELKRTQQKWKQIIAENEQPLIDSDNLIAELKTERHNRSIALQRLVFEKFKMYNGRGEVKDLCQIFADTPQGFPPAGAGECAAPKLLQYAYINNYTPIAMAEFWVGASPKDVIRHHGHYYPSCKAKCEPILNWMLTGLNVESNPLQEESPNSPIEILYEDKWLIAVNKPAGVLSTPSKLSRTSLVERLNSELKPNEQFYLIHRLDMATSGILIFAKTLDTYKLMQAKFKRREITKRYIAILDRTIKESDGTINLPLRLNIDDRPRQMVCFEHGKEAITKYEVIKRFNDKTIVAFYPVTGRTHQLRVHASHKDGLNSPITGDELYGTSSDRMYLHAEMIAFKHPHTNEDITITSPSPFESD